MPCATTSSDQPRVLLVDDNEAILEHAAAMLATNCQVVGTAKDGHSALVAADALNPDVIVLDVSMPGICGLEVAARLRARGSTAAIVFLTIHDDDDVVSAARDTGALAYVLKTRLASDLVTAAIEASAGRRFVSSDVPDALWAIAS